MRSSQQVIYVATPSQQATTYVVAAPSQQMAYVGAPPPQQVVYAGAPPQRHRFRHGIMLFYCFDDASLVCVQCVAIGLAIALMIFGATSLILGIRLLATRKYDNDGFYRDKDDNLVIALALYLNPAGYNLFLGKSGAGLIILFPILLEITPGILLIIAVLKPHKLTATFAIVSLSIGFGVDVLILGFLLVIGFFGFLWGANPANSQVSRLLILGIVFRVLVMASRLTGVYASHATLTLIKNEANREVPGVAVAPSSATVVQGSKALMQ